MTARTRQNLLDGLLCGLMVLLCAGLTVLQYRWTGEIADAEMVRLRGNLTDGARALARAFDAEIGRGSERLTAPGPGPGEPDAAARVEANFKAWRAGNPRPIFSRIALAVATGGEPEFFLLDQKSGRFARAEWPANWGSLRENLAGKRRGGGPPFGDAAGTLAEFPLFGADRPRRGPEDFPQDPQGRSPDGPEDFSPQPGPARERPPAREGAWLITELDLDYVRSTWLPELAVQYLNPDGRHSADFRIRTAGYDSQVVAASAAAVPAAAAAVAVGLNPRGRPGPNPRGPAPAGRWLLEAWPHPGVLDAVVAASRRRNLLVAGALNLLMLATGVALIQHTRRSRQLAETQMNFVASISHELRTPLTVIRGAAHNLQRGVVQERSQVELYSTLILQHTGQLTGMIEQLIELASRRREPAALVLQPIALPDVLREAIAAAEPETGAAGCQVALEIPAPLPSAAGDAAALRRVFQNLIANAAKHGGAGGWIGVTASLGAGPGAPALEVRVADRGPGIPADEQARIFEPFFRGARAQAEQVRGSGLGLSLVREIVAAHAGAVTVESQPGRGATFIVRLPLIPETPA